MALTSRPLARLQSSHYDTRAHAKISFRSQRTYCRNRSLSVQDISSTFHATGSHRTVHVQQGLRCNLSMMVALLECGYVLPPYEAEEDRERPEQSEDTKCE